jgi:hypothetical protein
VLGVGIGIRVNSDSAYTQLARGTNHPDGNFPPVGDKDLVEKGSPPRIVEAN